MNPGLELPHHDPNVYQTKPWMDKRPVWDSVSKKLETEAILQQLLACFISDVPGIDMISNLKYHIGEILTYIQENLHNDIRIYHSQKNRKIAVFIADLRCIHQPDH